MEQGKQGEQERREGVKQGKKGEKERRVGVEQGEKLNKGRRIKRKIMQKMRSCHRITFSLFPCAYLLVKKWTVFIALDTCYVLFNT